MSYSITDENGKWIGGRIYSEAKYAIPPAKRAAKAAEKAGRPYRFYIVRDDGGLYGKKVGLVSPYSAGLFA